MRQTKCVLCDVVITQDNDSKEHIIPNSLGGQKTIRGFICKDCNSEAGSKWDQELAKQLHPLCVLLNIQRDRGIVPTLSAETTQGETVRINPDGRITLPTKFTEQQDGDKIRIQICTKDMSEMKKKISEIAKKYPQIDTDSALKYVTQKSQYLSEPIGFDLLFGGKIAGRSIVKSAMALVAEAGVRVQECELARQYLMSDGEACFGYYNEKDWVENRPESTFFHCFHVQGDPATKQILAYAEYFGYQRIIMCLSNLNNS